MKKLIVGLICLCFAFSSVIANDQIISTYEVEPFDQHVSDEIISPLVGTSEIKQEQDESLCDSKSGAICPIQLQRVSQILQAQNAPFTPLVSKSTFEGREVVLSRSQLDVE